MTKLLYWIPLVGLLLPGASMPGGVGAGATEVPEPEVRRAAPAGRDPSVADDNDLARFYAGIPGAEGSPLKPWEGSALWKVHALKSSEDWELFFGGRGARMWGWAERGLRRHLGYVRSILYLFGGADLPTVLTFFPEVPVIVLVGLEPVGEVSHPGRLTGEELGRGLDGVRETLRWLLGRGFSETKELRDRLPGGRVAGVRALLYAALARMGRVLIGAEAISVGRARGVRIEYAGADGGQIRELYYLGADLSDAGDPAVLDFAGRFKPSGGYLKAASYLMFEENFSKVRAFLLGTCDFVLQDDSGIPLRAFDAARWRMVYYGKYVGVMPIFQKYFQPDLLSIYQTAGLAEPMPFGLGYRVYEEDACQILALRRQPANFPPPPPLDHADGLTQ